MLAGNLHEARLEAAYERAILADRITTLERNQMTMARSMATSNDHLLSDLHPEHPPFVTRFVSETVFTTAPREKPSGPRPSSNCQGDKEFFSGRYIPKGKTTKCFTWNATTPVSMFNHRSTFLVPTTVDVDHIPSIAEEMHSWTFLANHRDALQLAQQLQAAGGADTGLMDTLRSPGSIHRLFSLFGLGSLLSVVLAVFGGLLGLCCLRSACATLGRPVGLPDVELGLLKSSRR